MSFAYEVVAVVIIRLLSDVHLRFIITCRTCSVEEVLWKNLTSFVKFVAGSLYCSHVYVSDLLNDERDCCEHNR
jgi:hypothetical protein